MNSSYTFPQRVRNLPRGYYHQEPIQTGSDGMVGEPGARGSFHREGMKNAHKKVEESLQTTATNELVYLAGGHRNLRPKPQPQGSFSMPLNMTGNTGYGWNYTELKGKGTSGTFRTDAGGKYGRNLLKRRAEQLEDMTDAQKGIPPVRTESKPLSKDQTKEIAIELFMNSVVNSTLSHNWEDLKLEDLRKLFQGFNTTGRGMDMKQLTTYRNQLKEVIENIEVYYDRKTYLSTGSDSFGELLTKPDSYALKRGAIEDYEGYEDNLSRYDLIYKNYNLIGALIYSFDMQPKSRNAYLNHSARQISKTNIKAQQGLDGKLRKEAFVKTERRERGLKRGELLEPQRLPLSFTERQNRLRAETGDLTEEERKEYKEARERMEKIVDEEGEGIEYPEPLQLMDMLRGEHISVPSSSSSSSRRSSRSSGDATRMGATAPTRRTASSLPRFRPAPREVEEAEEAAEASRLADEGEGGTYFDEGVSPWEDWAAGRRFIDE